MSVEKAIQLYVDGGRVPWSKGYSEYKHKLVDEAIKDADILERFRTGRALPDNWGLRVDERIVEYPWVFSRLDEDAGLLLDAGSTFNKDFLLRSRALQGRRLIVYTLSGDWIVLDPNISYIFGDFREMLLRDACVQTISCISTLEHCGMGQDYAVHSAANHASDQNLTAYREVLAQFHRVLSPNGQLLVTVPYGRRENHGWLQQFDATTLADVINAFPGTHIDTTFYRYDENGWHAASQEECADLGYYNIHAAKGFDPDFAAAARGVACIEWRK